MLCEVGGADTMKLLRSLLDQQEKYSAWRRDLHAHPELAYEEQRTAAFVVAKLSEFGVSVEQNLGGTGVVGTLALGNGPARIGLRADMDALALQERNEFAHRSQHPGKMHACGHDGHTVMLLAAAECLAKERGFDGTVQFIFQPAEEGEAGARAMMDDGLFTRFPVDAVYGLHNWPWLPSGHFAVRAGAMMAAMDIFEARITGRGGHAAQPQLVTDPIVVAAQLIQAWQTVVSRNVDPLEAAVVSVTQVHAGNAWAVIPEDVMLRGTVRTFNPAVRDLVAARLHQLATGICTSHQCDLEWRHEHRFPATVNSANEAQFAAQTAAGVVGEALVDRDPMPSMGSEDFGYMLEEQRGCYAWLGAGRPDGEQLLHNPYYDFNDEIIPIGASYWVNLVRNHCLAP